MKNNSSIRKFYKNTFYKIIYKIILQKKHCEVLDFFVKVSTLITNLSNWAVKNKFVFYRRSFYPFSKIVCRLILQKKLYNRSPVIFLKLTFKEEPFFLNLTVFPWRFLVIHYSLHSLPQNIDCFNTAIGFPIL